MSEIIIESYLDTVGIRPADSYDELVNILKSCMSDQDVSIITDIMNGRASGSNDTEIYKLTNKSLESSVSFVGGFDGSFLKRGMKRIYQYRSLFGKEIVDIGCNNGILSCFIALICPESEVTGIDIKEEGLNCARELANKLEIHNIKFECNNYKKTCKKYDTVFMSKLSHELIDFSNINWYQSRSNIVSSFEKKSIPFVVSIKKMLKDNGTILMIDRIPYEIGVYGYYKAFASKGIALDMNTYHKLIYKTAHRILIADFLSLEDKL